MVHLILEGIHVGVKCLGTLTTGDVLKEVKFLSGELWDGESVSVHNLDTVK